MTGQENNHLKSYIDRLENLEYQRKSICDDINEVIKEAESEGFDKKAIKSILKIRKEGLGVHFDHQALIDTYLNALRMLRDTPLGEAAFARDFSTPKPTMQLLSAV